MARNATDTLLRSVRALAAGQFAGCETEHELLERFVRHHDEAAFTILLDRHGPMVLGVCRRAVRDEQLAEDVFQATFLILARTANTITNRTSLSDWLHGVARRQAGKALARTSRARRMDTRPAPEGPPDPLAEASWREVRQILDEELRRLPERYRRLLILCHLDGRTRDEAAAELGCTPGQLKGLLERGREQLRAWLIRRGLAPAVTGAVLLTETALAGPVPPLLAVTTLRCAVELASGKSLASCGAAAPVRSLLEGGLPIAGTKNILLVLVCALIACAGVFGMFGQPSAGSALQALAGDEPAKRPAANSAPPVVPNVLEAKDVRLEGTTVSGRVLTEPNGKPVVGHVVKLYRGGEPWLTTTTKTDDKGNYMFKGVKPGGYRVGLVYTEPHLWSEWGLVPHVTDKPVTADDLFRTLPQSVSGKVTDVETGEPVAKARILFSTADHDRDSIVTNEKGEYRIYVVAREVVLDCDGTKDRYEESEQHHKLTVTEGKETTGIGFKVRGSPKFTGLVVDNQGRPVQGADVLVEMRRDTLKPPGGYSEVFFKGRDISLKTDNEGRFLAYMSIAYPRGGAKTIRFKVLARTADQSLGGFVEAKADMESGFALDPLYITLQKTGSVKFRVLNPDGEPLEKAETNVSRIPDWPWYGQGGPPGIMKPLGKGKFEATGLIPSVEYYIAARADGYKLGIHKKAVLSKSDETADAGDITLIGQDKTPGGPEPQPIKSAEPKYKPIDRATIAAYEKLGAKYSTLKVDEYGNVIYDAVDGLPGFTFERLPDEKLPPVGVPFYLGCHKAADGELKALNNLINLTHLELWYKQVTDTGLKELKGLNNLRWLSLLDTNVTDEGLKELRELHNLDSLDLGYTAVTDAGMKELKDLKNLTRLSLYNTKVTDVGLKELQGLKNLKSLLLINLGVTDAGLKELKGLNKLTMLDLYGTAVTDAGMRELRELKDLSFLELSKTKVGDAGLRELKHLKSLSYLGLVGTKVTNGGLKDLKSLERLTRLGLGDTAVSDAGMKELKEFKNLTFLGLQNTQVTDEGVKELKGLKGLQNLTLYGVAVSKAAIKDLQEALPRCSIQTQAPSGRGGLGGFSDCSVGRGQDDKPATAALQRHGRRVDEGVRGYEVYFDYPNGVSIRLTVSSTGNRPTYWSVGRGDFKPVGDFHQFVADLEK